MQTLAILVAIFAALFIPPFLMLFGERKRAARTRERERRIAEARMNARLLRLNI